MEHLEEDIKAKLKKLEQYDKKKREHMDKCAIYQRERMKFDEEFRKMQYGMSRDYQRRRYNADPEFRNAKLLKMRERYQERNNEKKKSLGDENLEVSETKIQKKEKPENNQK